MQYGKKSTIEFLENTSCDQPSSDLSKNQPCKSAYEKTIKTLSDKITKLNKSKHRPKGAAQLEEFLNSNFIFPKADASKRVPHVSCDDDLNLKLTLVSEIQKSQKLTEKLVETEQSVQDKASELSHNNAKLKSCQLKLKRTAARESYAQNKVLKLEEKVLGECCKQQKDRIRELEKQLLERDTQINDLNVHCDYLQDLINENQKEVLEIFDEKSKRYTSAFKNCVYELLKSNVSAAKVGDVVKSVLCFVNVTPNKLPSKPTVLDMNLQRLCLAQKQINEIFSKEEDTCLLTDETSKFGAKYMGYEASDSSGNLWVLGLREIETKSADDTIKVFKQILSDLDNSAQESIVSKDILCHISATMSDRAATELKFNELLETYRKEILPLTYCNYDRFTDAEKSSIESLNNFFCGLHALVNYAETSQKCMLQVDKEIFDETAPAFDVTYNQKSEPGSCRLIRTAAKAFGEGSGGDEKSGCQGKFRTFISDFLKENNMKTVPLRSYRGSRFNILFSNASAVFYLHDKMIEYLERYGAENRLLKAVLFDLKVQEYIAGVKSLGLINKFITGPLWSVLEDKQVSIEDMNTKYLELVSYLEDACENIEDFMTGNLQVFPDHVERDCFLEKLLLPQAYDQIVQSYLEVILSALCTLCKKLYNDHLPGGKLTLEPIKATSAPKTSCFAESVFGQMDQMMRSKPNLSTLAAEASIMFANNRTLEWLNAKTTEERDECIRKASRHVPSLKRKFKTRLTEISESRKRAMEEKILKKENAQREKIRKKEMHTNEILFHGLWQSRDEVDRMLENYDTNAQKIEALKAQLKFRKEVLLQVPESRTDYNFTKKVEGKKSRQSLSVDELIDNLKSLVQQAVVKDSENEEQRHMLVGKRIRHRFDMEENGQLTQTWYTGKVISQVPLFRHWFNVVYDGDEAVYTLRHLPEDLDREDLKIIV